MRRPQGKDSSTSEQAAASGQEQQQQQYTHILCISPDAPTNPVLYWLGNFDPAETRFILDGALGPLKLDLGDTLYAPNLLEDEEVCTVIYTPYLFCRCVSLRHNLEPGQPSSYHAGFEGVANALGPLHTANCRQSGRLRWVSACRAATSCGGGCRSAGRWAAMTMRAACPCLGSCTSLGTDCTRYSSPILQSQRSNHTSFYSAPILEGVCPAWHPFCAQCILCTNMWMDAYSEQ